MSAERAYRVLHLDDSPLDAELIEERIAAEEPELWRFEHVETGPRYEAALGGDWDLILTDYNIPGYDGMTAVRRAHAAAPDVPVIVVSGTLSEEDAVASLRAGATDYIFKQRLQRVGPAAKRAIAEARERRQRREAEAVAQELSKRFSLLARYSRDVFWMMDLEPAPQVTFVSPSVEQLWGVPPEAFYGDADLWLRMIHPEDRGRVEAAHADWVAQRIARYDEEYRVVRPNGEVLWIHDTGTPLSPESGGTRQISGVARDVTARKEAARAFMEQERLFRVMFEQAAVGMAFLDLDGRRVRFNRRYAEIVGYEPEELRPELRVAHPEDAHGARERRQRLIDGEAVTRGTKRYIRKDGRVIWCDITNSLVRDDEDRPRNILTVIQDVTDRIRAEARLRDSETLFRSTVNAMVEGVSVQDGENRMVFVNPGVMAISGLTREQMLGRSVADPQLQTFREDGSPLPPEERPSVVALRSGRMQKSFVYGFQRPDGRLAWISANAQPLRNDGEARPHAVVTTYHDITEARAAAVALRESERRQRALISNLQGMVYRCRGDPERTMEFVSEGSRVLLGVEPEALIDGGLQYAELIHPGDRDRVRAELDAADAERRTSTVEYSVRHADGGWRKVVEKGGGVWDAQGELVAREGLVWDITDRVLLENELRELNATLERRVADRTEDLMAANRELEAFSYSVSHDLRAPLGAIRGFADALAEAAGERLGPDERHYLDRIRAGGERMDRLIEDMLSLARISRADLVASDIDLTALVEEVVAEVRERAPQRPCRIRVQPGMRAHADPRLLRIALDNLVGNAFKFSSNHPEVVLEAGRQPGAGLAATFFIRDEGAGFDPAHAAKLFGTFQRLHTQSEFPGTGIGLATVRRVIERHGGNVWAEGQVGKGATVYFTLPLPGAGTSAGASR